MSLLIFVYVWLYNRWTIETSGERGSGKSVLVARLDDDEKTHNRTRRPLFHFRRNRFDSLKGWHREGIPEMTDNTSKKK